MLEELQAKSLELIKEVDNICKKYGVTYYAEGGTAIGAIRHNGFIPWDDDTDIIMTRDNFNKFVEGFKKENLENRVLDYPEGKEDYPLVTIKYIDTSTTRIFRSLFSGVGSGGLFVDIFILDPVPKGREKWFKKEFLSYCELLCPHYIINSESRVWKYKLDLFKCKLFGKEKVINGYRKRLFNFSDEECEEYIVRWGIAYQVNKKEYYGEPRYYKFADTYMPVASKAERILEDFFGDDWHMIPPSEEEISHDLVTNLNVSSKRYIKDYMRFVDRKKLNKCYVKSKKYAMMKNKTERKNTRTKLNARYMYDNLKCSKIDAKIAKEYYNNQQYYDAYKYVEYYVNAQSRSDYRKFKLELDVNEELKYYTLMTLINSGLYYKASKMLKAFKNKSDKILNIEKTLLLIKEARDLYFENEYDRSLILIDDLLKENKDNLSAYKIKMEIILKDKLSKEELENILEELMNYYENTNDVELNKYIGDVYKLLNKNKLSKEYYDKAKINNRNGLMLLEINK